MKKDRFKHNGKLCTDEAHILLGCVSAYPGGQVGQSLIGGRTTSEGVSLAVDTMYGTPVRAQAHRVMIKSS